MKIHEYQGKQLFARYGVPVPKGEPAFQASEVAPIADRLIAQTGNPVVVVKAQIHAGGRGKGGGVKVAKGGSAEATALAEKILGMQLVTKQTGPEGQKVRRLYIEQGLDIARELYFAMLVDRERRRIAVIASTEGGMDIEEVAHSTPEKIFKLFIDPVLGLAPYQGRQLAIALGLTAKETQRQFLKLVASLYACFTAEDCSLLEINPLVVTRAGDVFALDAKVSFDDNAEFRHPEWNAMRDVDEEDPVELQAKRSGLSYVSLDGDIGCLVNGAGLAMATMDIILHYGGRPANFLDVGGGASQEQVKTAFQIILRSERVRGIFVNIFGGIMRCDVVAAGVIAAAKELGLKVPLVVRLEGTNVEAGRKLLDESGLTIQSASSMADGAQKIVAATRGKAQGGA
ncbi:MULTISPECIES: ADP-forming succinate--CoA ligase subunit beta [Sorangium]|uniref:Succinate--CoA ligase [ADP-forming] subunit beta n=1 Tax=Sorangium cellulosum TaxID=56 RepID=A0A4P2R5K0_SORCE|nr:MULTISPECIES: ADP-forming succinate--CoA ligase subunit beta [Sorangium]AUX38400.1 malate--CoA ligase subunit beta [Sorangium cellulosum]WCQ97688.1 Succinate--CoA ligase [ADP-forming] subunit beta [Sorangium sp. Soce836]